MAEVDNCLALFEDWEILSWEAAQNAATRVIEHLEATMKRWKIWPPSEDADEPPVWRFDDKRKEWCYWSARDNVFKFDSGVWVRPDGSETRCGEGEGKSEENIEKLESTDGRIDREKVLME